VIKNISQGSVATQLRCGGISGNHFITNFPQNVPVQKKFRKSVNIWWIYGQLFAAYFYGPPCTRHFTRESMYAIARICYPSVRLPVCPSVRRVDHRKMVEVRIMKSSPYGSHIPLVFCGVSFIQKF